jgi:hypothetical protein
MEHEFSKYISNKLAPHNLKKPSKPFPKQFCFLNLAEK